MLAFFMDKSSELSDEVQTSGDNLAIVIFFGFKLKFPSVHAGWYFDAIWAVGAIPCLGRIFGFPNDFTPTVEYR
jgi:hypothetical protein